MRDPGKPSARLRARHVDQYLIRVPRGPWGILGDQFMTMDRFIKAVQRGERWAVRANAKMNKADRDASA
jgi:hypothetical protein